MKQHEKRKAQPFIKSKKKGLKIACNFCIFLNACNLKLNFYEFKNKETQI